MRAGASHFGEQASEFDESARRDLAALALRGQILRGKFYGQSGAKSVSGKKFFQLGTVVEGRGEFYSSRLSRKEVCFFLSFQFFINETNFY